MDWNQEALMAMQVVIAVILGGFVGWEREWHGREAGIRTYGAVSLGACVFALLSTHITTGNNPHVLATGVVSGIGFLGAGVIMRDRGSVTGLTTAATLWATAAVGMATGYGMYTLATLVTLIIFGLLWLHHLPGWHRLKQRGPAASANAEPGGSAPAPTDPNAPSPPPAPAPCPHERQHRFSHTAGIVGHGLAPSDRCLRG